MTATSFMRMQMLEEVRKVLDFQLAEIEVSKTSVRTILGTASLILSVVVAFFATNPTACDLDCVVNMRGAGILYIFVLGMSLWLLAPTDLELPINIDQENVRDFYSKYATEDLFIESLIHQYILAIDINEPIVSRHADCVIGTGVGFALMLLVLVAPFFASLPTV